MLQLASIPARKIKSAQEIARLVGPCPRERKVVMCHGHFDLVHPGHIRHLYYAKSKVDILVASLTADIHVKKGAYRPHVPQDLRALNLAALECVDYVVVDANPTPVENIALIQPDYFAKGFEYAKGEHEKTAQEQEVVASYGGEMLFTPGDIVYSSSRFIEADPPKIATEKLIALLETEGLDFRQLRRVLGQLAGIKVHVVGDTIIDSYTRCTMLGAGAKTPTISVLYDKKDDFIGGAAIVAMHLKAAGADVTFSTVLGDDDLGKFALDTLENAGVKCLPVIDRTRPTTNKNAIVASGYRMLKIDKLDNRLVDAKNIGRLAEQVHDVDDDIVVFSDFRHGIFNRETASWLAKVAPSHSYRVADSQVASRWGNILDFKGFDLIAPNEKEARFALGDQESAVIPLARDLCEQASCGMLILKLGERGIITYCENDWFFNMDSFASHVADAVGAGDALLAYASMCLDFSKGPVIGSVLGSFAAAIECERDGNVPVTVGDVMAKIDEVERIVG